VLQLLKEPETGVDLPTDVSAIASGKPPEVVPDVENLDLVKMPAICDYEGDETAWRKGLPSGEVRSQLRELGLSESDSNSSDTDISDSMTSDTDILCVCLDGFNGDDWMSDVEEVQNDKQVGEAERVNDPAAILCLTTAWSAGAEDVASAKVAERAGESGKLPTSALTGKTVCCFILLNRYWGIVMYGHGASS